MKVDLPLHKERSSEWPTEQPKAPLPVYIPGTIGHQPSIVPLSGRDIKPYVDDHWESPAEESTWELSTKESTQKTPSLEIDHDSEQGSDRLQRF